MSNPLTLEEAKARVGWRIRATNPNGFRCGWWAEIIGAGIYNSTHRAVAVAIDGATRPTYMVVFPDDTADLWPVNDPSDPYEFEDPDAEPADPATRLLHIARELGVDGDPLAMPQVQVTAERPFLLVEQNDSGNLPTHVLSLYPRPSDAAAYVASNTEPGWTVANLVDLRSGERFVPDIETVVTWEPAG